MNLLIIVGTRPNFIKITQFNKIANQYPEIDIKIAHTGQHHKHNMADVFFEQFGLVPDFFMNISVSTPNTQMAEVMQGVEKIAKQYEPDLIIVVGDVNSTFAAALTANKMGIKLAHLESGLRSGDKSMPEEVNRILTDQVANYFFVTEQSGVDNLKKEGLDHNIFLVGNTMIDTLVAFDDKIQQSGVLEKLDLIPGDYILMTIHRPATVDNENGLKKLIELIKEISNYKKNVFPIHPRTVDKLKYFNLYDQVKNINNLILTDPLDYFSFQKLIAECKLIITDSGGIQEESTFRQVPCLTLRSSTERPSTIELGTNQLITFDLEEIEQKIELIENGSFKKGEIPPLWDGKATQRILKIISDLNL